MFFMERWEHGSGLTVKAWDSKFVGDIAITRGSIDEILKNQAKNGSDDVGDPDWTAHGSFEEFVVLRGDRVLYSSSTQEGEQAAPSNR